MKTKTLLICSLLMIFLLVSAKLTDDYFHEVKLQKYYLLIKQLEKKGFDPKEAQYIALIESGFRSPDSLYYEYLNHQKSFIHK